MPSCQYYFRNYYCGDQAFQLPCDYIYSMRYWHLSWRHIDYSFEQQCHSLLVPRSFLLDLDKRVTLDPFFFRSQIASLSPPVLLSQSAKNSYSHSFLLSGLDSIWYRLTLCTCNMMWHWLAYIDYFIYKMHDQNCFIMQCTYISRTCRRQCKNWISYDLIQLTIVIIITQLM